MPSSSADRRFHALEPTFDILVYEILTDSRLFCDCVCLCDELQRAQDQRVADKLECRCFAQYGTVGLFVNTGERDVCNDGVVTAPFSTFPPRSRTRRPMAGTSV